mmetsp:Transcript_80381/g.260436  ORF Transcript_80381/g.260436 Transcript_80381/m.260436 type:complete len:271 (-) Transcript_80381:35-847(-)
MCRGARATPHVRLLCKRAPCELWSSRPLCPSALQLDLGQASEAQAQALHCHHKAEHLQDHAAHHGDAKARPVAAVADGGVAHLVHDAAQGEDRSRHEGRQREDVPRQEDAEHDGDGVLREVRQRAVGAVVRADRPLRLQHHVGRPLLSARGLVDHHVRPEVPGAHAHDHALVEHGVVVQPRDEEAEDHRRGVQVAALAVHQARHVLVVEGLLAVRVDGEGDGRADHARHDEEGREEGHEAHEAGRVQLREAPGRHGYEGLLARGTEPAAA